jgi:hypothetical protein
MRLYITIFGILLLMDWWISMKRTYSIILFSFIILFMKSYTCEGGEGVIIKFEHPPEGWKPLISWKKSLLRLRNPVEEAAKLPKILNKSPYFQKYFPDLSCKGFNIKGKDRKLTYQYFQNSFSCALELGTGESVDLLREKRGREELEPEFLQEREEEEEWSFSALDRLLISIKPILPPLKKKHQGLTLE